MKNPLEAAAKGGQKTAGLAQEALALMLRYSWPGNVRELQNAMHFALVTSRGKTISPADLPREIRQEQRQRGPNPKISPDAVQTALERTGGNKSRAAKLLGVGRATLYRYLESSADVS